MSIYQRLLCALLLTVTAIVWVPALLVVLAISFALSLGTAPDKGPEDL